MSLLIVLVRLVFDNTNWPLDDPVMRAYSLEMASFDHSIVTGSRHTGKKIDHFHSNETDKIISTMMREMEL